MTGREPCYNWNSDFQLGKCCVSVSQRIQCSYLITGICNDSRNGSGPSVFRSQNCSRTAAVTLNREDLWRAIERVRKSGLQELLRQLIDLVLRVKAIRGR